MQAISVTECNFNFNFDSDLNGRSKCALHSTIDRSDRRYSRINTEWNLIHLQSIDWHDDYRGPIFVRIIKIKWISSMRDLWMKKLKILTFEGNASVFELNILVRIARNLSNFEQTKNFNPSYLYKILFKNYSGKTKIIHVDFGDSLFE